MHLTGKHALVTGGGTGIGLAIAQALAGQGAKVTITGRRAAPLEAAATDLIHPAVMDVTDPDAVAEVISSQGPIDICVANAGIAEGRSIFKTDLEFWRAIMATNLDGAFLTVRETMKTMAKLDWGRVIVVSSVAGTKGLKGAPAYAASKHGVVGLIRALAQDFVTSGLTFNALCPAYVATDIIDRNVTSISERAGVSTEEALQMMVGLNPHGRLIEAQEVAEAALWLCGPGSGSVNGQAIEIAGGVT